MARLLLTDYLTEAAFELPYSSEVDLTLTDQPEGATKVVLARNGTPEQTLFVQETPTQIRRREDICLF